MTLPPRDSLVSLKSCLSRLAFKCYLAPLSYFLSFPPKHQLSLATATHCHYNCTISRIFLKLLRNSIFWAISCYHRQSQFYHQIKTLVLICILLLCWELFLFPASADMASSWPTVQKVIAFQDLLTFAGRIPWEMESV